MEIKIGIRLGFRLHRAAKASEEPRGLYRATRHVVIASDVITTGAASRVIVLEHRGNMFLQCADAD